MLIEISGMSSSLPSADNKFIAVRAHKQLLIATQLFVLISHPFVLFLLRRQSKEERLAGAKVELFLLSLVPQACAKGTEYLSNFKNMILT